MIRKYMYFIIVAIKKELIYKENIVGLWITTLFSILIQIKLWEAIYHGKQAINGIVFSSVFMYFICGMVYMRLLSGGVSDKVSADYRSGNIAIEILKPQSYFLKMMFSDIGRGIVQIISVFVLAVIFCLYYSVYVKGVSYWIVIYVFVSVCIGYIINLLMEYCIGLTSIWFGTSVGLAMLKTSFFAFLGGVMIPLDFYPNWLRHAISIFPFKYIYYEPLSYLLNEGTFMKFGKSIAIQVVWLAVFSIVAYKLRQVADRRITIQGG